jgi:hypothetical protein
MRGTRIPTIEDMAASVSNHQRPFVCGSCGCDARRMETFNCPRCGEDVRIVGLIPRPERSGPPFGLIIWLIFILVACGITSDMLNNSQRVERVRTHQSYELTLREPPGNKLLIESPLRSVPGVGQGRLTYIDGASGQRNALWFEQPSMRFQISDSLLARIPQEGIFDEPALLRWLEAGPPGSQPPFWTPERIAALMSIIQGTAAAEQTEFGRKDQPVFSINSMSHMGGQSASTGFNSLPRWTLSANAALWTLIWFAGLLYAGRRSRKPAAKRGGR